MVYAVMIDRICISMVLRKLRNDVAGTETRPNAMRHAPPRQWRALELTRSKESSHGKAVLRYAQNGTNPKQCANVFSSAAPGSRSACPGKMALSFCDIIFLLWVLQFASKQMEVSYKRPCPILSSLCRYSVTTVMISS